MLARQEQVLGTFVNHAERRFTVRVHSRGDPTFAVRGVAAAPQQMQTDRTPGVHSTALGAPDMGVN